MTAVVTQPPWGKAQPPPAGLDVDTETVTVLDGEANGQPVSQFSFPEADYLGYPTLGPGGELAFYVAAISEHADGYPVKGPGAIYLVWPPYDGEPQLVKSEIRWPH